MEFLNAMKIGAGRRTVMLGHGFGVDQGTWGQLKETLVAAGYRVVTFDFPGVSGHCYESFDENRHSTLFGFAEDVLRVAEKTKTRNATYVGHSLGGMAGLLA